MTTLAIDIGGTKLAAALVTDDLLLCDRRSEHGAGGACQASVHAGKARRDSLDRDYS